MKGAAQDPKAGRGGVKDPLSGPGPILEAAPHHGVAWAEPVQQGLGQEAALGLDSLQTLQQSPLTLNHANDVPRRNPNLWRSRLSSAPIRPLPLMFQLSSSNARTRAGRHHDGAFAAI